MSKEGQPGTDMIGLLDSILASGQFCTNYRTFDVSCLFTFPVNFHSVSVLLANGSSGYWHLPCISSLPPHFL